jgi:hypothetical protein
MTLGANQLTADSVSAAEQVASTQRVNTAHAAAILDRIARLTAEPDLRPSVLQEPKNEMQQAPDACDVVVDDDGIDEDADLQLLGDLWLMPGMSLLPTSSLLKRVSGMLCIARLQLYDAQLPLP